MQHGTGSGNNDFVFVSVSDGLGVGVFINGELVRGRHNTAGEFGHVDNPTAAMWFNPAAFARNPVVTGVAIDGTSARNLLYGPSYHGFDLTISRDIRLGERYKLNLRAEGTNVFNTVNLGQPGSTAGTTTLGVITSAGAMRKVQFGARFTF